MAPPPANTGLARVDLLAFIMGLTSYAELVGEGTEGATEEVFRSGSRHCIRADVSELLQGFLEGIKRAFENETSEPIMLLTALSQAEAKRGVKKFLFVGTKLPAILNWFQSRRDSFQDVLPGPAGASIQALLVLGDIQDPQQRLKALGEFGYRSTIRVFRKWILEEALPSLSLAPQGIQATVADITAAKPYVEQIQQVQLQLASTEPGSEDAAELNGQKVELQGQLDDLVEESSNPMAVETAVGNALGEDPLTKISQRYGLDEDQATVVASSGNVVVSAGAGSGKTTTLIAVVQDSLLRGYRGDQILGTTFTRKAKSEFNERMTAKGVTGVQFSTTHSIAGQLIRMIDPKLEPQLDKPEKRAGKLFEIAIKQVQMKPSRPVEKPNLIEKPIVPDEEGSPREELVKQHLARVLAAQRKHPWSDFLRELADQLDRPGAYPLKGRALEFLEKMEARAPGGRRAADEMGHQAAAVSKPKTAYWNEPANMWWNLGLTIRDSKKGLQSRVGRWQNGGKSWQSVWKEFGQLPPPSADDISAYYEAAAVYAAYAWLKQNDPQYGPVLDYDDWLSKAIELLKRKPKALASLQDRYKVIIVDEAQDLNGLQWELFGMLSKKTERYLLVGDDYQAIYAFRGASSDQFIKKPEEGFKLLQMGINYRSGRNIVETANKLIAVNTNQINKTCRAARQNGDGHIEARIVPTHEDVARETADSISNLIKAGSKPSDFGIAVRNNAEMDAFCLALMGKRIPFVCKRDPLEGFVPKSVLAWFTLAVGIEAGREQVNEAISIAHQSPGFNLNTVFNQELRAGVKKGSDQLTTLLDGFEPYTGRESYRNAYVELYAKAIRKIQTYGKSDDVIRAILDIQGKNGNTFLDDLLENVDPEDVDPTLSGDARKEAMETAAQLPLKPLFGVAEEIPNPVEYITYINKMRRAQAALKKGAKDEETSEPAVRIGTAHGWKGLEAEHMYVCMADGVFPSSFAAEEDENGMEEERRLAYVAVTRGKKSVTVFSPLESYRGPRPSRPGVPPPPPRASLFVDEMQQGGCMDVIGAHLLIPGGGLLPPPRQPDAEDEEVKEPKLARQVLASLDPRLEAEPLDPHWTDLV